jgi:membrane-associated phospholipid phosphatase
MSRLLASLVATALLVFVCHCYVDAGLALLISREIPGASVWARHTSAIPDFLFLLVCIMTGVAVVCYFVRTWRGIDTPATRFFHLVAYAVPAAYVGKTILKWVFGRVTTRAWLQKPQLYGFHWFHGGGPYDGFPSGHMAVFTALTVALWRFFPRCRRICPVFPLVLASALIVTNYHFLSDVLAGAYLGVLVEAASYRLLNRRGIPGQ